MSFKFSNSVLEVLEKSKKTSNTSKYIEVFHIVSVLLSYEKFIKIIGDKKKSIFQYVETESKKIISKKKEEEKHFSISMMNVFYLAKKKSDYFGDEYIKMDLFILAVLISLSEHIFVDIKEVEEKIMSLRESDENLEDNNSVFENFTVNLTQKAQKGELDPVIGRENEIRRLIQIICRRTKNNPILIGDPGVGKSAIVEGLALRIINNDVPELLKNHKILTLDLSALLAGSKYRGDFEERLKELVAKIISQKKIILFIDEIHTLVGAGKSEGAMDAANILKPALARGELMCIGATTGSEYSKYIEKDAALERRFQAINVFEPNVEESMTILRGLKEKYENHHGVRITDAALEYAVKLSSKYINDRKLPDKAIDLIDEAASRIRMIIDSEPEILDSNKRELINLKMKHSAISKEENVDTNSVLNIEKQIKNLEKEIEIYSLQWEKDKVELQKIRKLKKKLEQEKINKDKAQREGNLTQAAEILYGKIPEIEKQIKEMQQNLNSKILKEVVTEKEVALVLEKWVGISSEKLMETDQLEKIKNMESILQKQVIGQKQVISSISKIIKRSKMGMSIDTKPLGVFLCIGPTGVGKTELARSLADFLFDDPNSMLRIDCSEFMEMHNVARLIGAPPGYVGHDEGGVLTESVRKKPYQLILLDEIEKAHKKVFDIFLQIFDAGRLTDGRGKIVDFKQTIILMTSNIGANLMLAANQNKSKIMQEVKNNFKLEFINRLDDILFFNKLDEQSMEEIVDLRFKNIQKRVQEQDMEVSLTSKAKKWFAKNGYDPQFGARPLIRLMEDKITDLITDAMIDKKIGKNSKIVVDFDDEIKLDF